MVFLLVNLVVATIIGRGHNADDRRRIAFLLGLPARSAVPASPGVATLTGW